MASVGRWGVWVLAAVLSACGGGGDDSPRTSAVRVAGDSLNDGGTFGFKFTVQGASLASTQVWVDRVAAGLGVSPLCPRYAATGPDAVSLSPTAPSCTSHAVGGGRINPVGTAGDTTPFAIPQQLRDLAAAGAYGPEELLLVDGGGNDVADLLGAYLGIAGDGGLAYTSLLKELLPAATVDAAATGGATALAQAGGAYMLALADRLADAIATQALQRGAQRVLVMNVPDVSRTPRFQAVLQGVAQASGGGEAGAAVAARVAAVAQAWVQAFNAQLQARLVARREVAVLDLYTALNQWLDGPAAYGFTNTRTPACPSNGVDAQGLPTYAIQTCTETGLSATPPAGQGPAWWQSHVFADNFHGTPLTNRLIGEVALQTLRGKGWR